MKRGLTGRYETTAVGGERVHAFVPTPLPPVPALDLSGSLQHSLERAHLALGRLDSLSTLLPDSHFFLYSYVRKEAVLSSMIEGTQSSLSDLLLFELDEAPGVPLDDVVEVSNYVAALSHRRGDTHEQFAWLERYALGLAQGGEPLGRLLQIAFAGGHIRYPNPGVLTFFTEVDWVVDWPGRRATANETKPLDFLGFPTCRNLTKPLDARFLVSKERFEAPQRFGGRDSLSGLHDVTPEPVTSASMRRISASRVRMSDSISSSGRGGV